MSVSLAAVVGTVECCPSCLAASIYFCTFSEQLGAHAGLICAPWVHRRAQLTVRRLWGPARQQSRAEAVHSPHQLAEVSFPRKPNTELHNLRTAILLRPPEAQDLPEAPRLMPAFWQGQQTPDPNS